MKVQICYDTTLSWTVSFFNFQHVITEMISVQKKKILFSPSSVARALWLHHYKRPPVYSLVNDVSPHVTWFHQCCWNVLVFFTHSCLFHWTCTKLKVHYHLLIHGRSEIHPHGIVQRTWLLLFASLNLFSSVYPLMMVYVWLLCLWT